MCSMRIFQATSWVESPSDISQQYGRYRVFICSTGKMPVLQNCLPPIRLIRVLEGSIRVEIEHAIPFIKLEMFSLPPIPAHSAVADEGDAQVVNPIHHMHVAGDAELDVVIPQHRDHAMRVVMHHAVAHVVRAAFER